MARPRIDILFDARHLRSSGIGSYTRTSLQALSQLVDEDGVTCSVVVRPRDLDQLPSNLVGRHRTSDADMYSVSEQLMWHRLLLETRPELAWFPHYPVPLLAGRQNAIVTIYDLLHAASVDEGGPGGFRARYVRAMVEKTSRGSARILTISDFTRRALESDFPRLSGRVSVTQMEVGPEWFDRDVERPRSGGLPYFVFVGNVVPQKDVATLIAAFDEVSRVLPHELVIVGGGASTRSGDAAATAAGKALGRVHFLGNVAFGVLRGLVAGADALVMPSLYEGLGLPPLEAMAIGTPAIISDAPALVEGAGDAALVFPRGDAKSLAALMMRVVKEDGLADRLQESGLRHVQGRTRQRAIAELLAVLRTELAGSS